MSVADTHILCPCRCGRLILREEYARWTGTQPPAPPPTPYVPSYRVRSLGGES